ncbi:MAG: PAS domain-containing protein [Vicinamibacterales bacterium]
MSEGTIEEPTRPAGAKGALAALPPGADDRLLAAIVANMFAGVMLCRASDAAILYANPRFAAMFGYTPGELEGSPVAILNAPGEVQPEDVAARIIARLEAEGAWRGEVENIRKDGTRFWCQAHVATFDHMVFGTVWVVVQLDITEMKRAQDETRRSEERLGLVLQATRAGAWDWNVQTGEVYFSPFWIASLGYSPDEVPPTAAFWESLIHPDDMPRVRAALADHFEGRTPAYECVNRLRRKDGSWRWNLDCGRVVERTAEGAPVRMVGTDTDLTNQRWSGLQEIVRICAGCKKICEEGGEWRTVEAHFGERSLAQFSHGLCPSCVEGFYGEHPGLDQ